MKLSGLKLLRKKYKFTQEELAKKVGTTGRSVTRWEQGHSFPKGKKLDRLMEIFGCKLDDLINGNPSNEVTARKTRRIKHTGEESYTPDALQITDEKNESAKSDGGDPRV